MHDKNLELTIPQSESLKSSILEQKNENEIIENQTKSPPFQLQNELNTSEPYWLRPTTAQLYPYNFIMALRKKLEQITYPSIQTVQHRHQPMEYQKFSQIIDSQQQDASQSEDYSTNFSSATLTTQQTKTSAAMNASSHQTNDIDEKDSDTQDTLSISSGILSHSSPEKQTKTTTSQTKTNAPSPLSMDQIDGLQITSKNSSKISQTENERQSNAREHIKSFINFSRGNAYEDLRPLTIEVEDENTQNTENIDVNQMLNEFNENLSHVIKVNRQLHSMLSNPASQRSLSVSANRTEQTSQKYSDDFENIDITKSHISQSRSTQSNRNSTQIHSKSDIPSFRSNKSSSSTLKSTRDTVTEQIVKAHTNSISAVRTTSSQKISKSLPEIVTEEIASETYKSSKRNGQNTNSIQSIHKRIVGEKEMTNTSIGSDIRGVFKQYELEYSEEMNSTSWSDANRSLSSLGMVRYL